ncbi:MAG TPA: mannitol dehydrogenase family protein [Casimicrobiaceae bacterium]|nr:mannitol dehydrogenase family protein [Casimicrobiaceae bacterium]
MAHANRLDLSTLDGLPAPIATPRYDPRMIGVGIVHLGIGAFHRAQTATFCDDALALERADWGICGVSLRSPDVRDRLTPQDGLYTAVEKDPDATRRRVIGSVREVLFLGDQRDAVRTRMIEPETRIVSLTITEKGYCHDPATGRLNHAHPDIAHDLAHPDEPESALGLIVGALDARRLAHGRAFTVLCCDNLPHNGAMLRALVEDFAEARDPELARWIDRHATFPSTMVDRIVPATTDADIAANDAALGVHDAAPVVHERFRQWAIEDAFVSGRPPWDRVGADLVADVAPFEAMKLRLLNGSHSALAYLGFLAGHRFIHQAMAAPAFAAYVRGMMTQEVAPTLEAPQGVDLRAYQDALAERFSNPALPHRTQQIAMDGSQKLPQRLLGTVRDNLAANRPFDRLALAIAAWMRYVGGIDEDGREIAVSDPLAGELARIAGHHRSRPAGYVRAMLGVRAVFGDDLAANERFVARLTASLQALVEHGAAGAVQRIAVEAAR